MPFRRNPYDERLFAYRSGFRRPDEFERQAPMSGQRERNLGWARRRDIDDVYSQEAAPQRGGRYDPTGEEGYGLRDFEAGRTSPAGPLRIVAPWELDGWSSIRSGQPRADRTTAAGPQLPALDDHSRRRLRLVDRGRRRRREHRGASRRRRRHALRRGREPLREASRRGPRRVGLRRPRGTEQSASAQLRRRAARPVPRTLGPLKHFLQRAPRGENQFSIRAGMLRTVAQQVAGMHRAAPVAQLVH